MSVFRDRYRIRVVNGNEVRIEGAETGELSVVKVAGDIVVLKEAGHSYWAGLPPTPRGYAPMSYCIFRREADGWFYPAVDFAPSKPREDVLEALAELVGSGVPS